MARLHPAPIPKARLGDPQALRKQVQQLQLELKEARAELKRYKTALPSDPSDPRNVGDGVQITVSIQHLFAVVELETGLSRADLTGGSRDYRVCKARWILTWLARRYTRLSLREIGEYLDRDRTTIRHGIALVERVIRACKIKPRADGPSAWAYALWSQGIWGAPHGPLKKMT